MSCTKCDLHKDCNKSGMKGRGSKAKYMLVLDIPTKSDNKAGFSPSGDVFLKIKYLLNKAKINESDVYITNAIKCFTPDLTKIKKVHYEACNEHLLNEIVNYNPKAIIACGKIAWQMISGHTSVGEYVGHVEDFSFDVVNDDDSVSTVNKKIFPAYSINASLFDWTLHHDILLAFSKAKKYVEHNQIDKCPDPNVKTILSMDDLKLAKEEILSYKWCATDFETTGLQFWKDKIINSGYCGELGKVFVFYHNPYMKSHIDDWNSEQIELGKEINRFLKYHKGDVENTLREIHGSHIKWVLHNSKFDLKFAKRFNIPYKNLFFDTLVADSLIDENMGHSLNECYVRRGINYGAYDTELYRYVGKKSLKTYQYVPPQTLIKYLGYDCEGVYRMVKIMQQQLKEIDMYEHFIKVKMPSIEILLDMEYRGVKYDKPLLLEASNLIKKKIDEQKEALLKITKNPEFNPNSDKQIIDFITTNKYPVKRLGLTLTKKGKLSVNSENLKKFIGTKYEEFPKTILNIKKLVKLKGTYIDGKEGEGGMLQYLDSNNMLHANYNIWTAVTGRYSCFAEGTPIEVIRDLKMYPKGVPIEKVKIGDLAYTYKENGELTIRKVLNVFNNGKKEVVRLHWSSSSGRLGYVDVTEDHLIKTYNRGFVRVDELNHGDKLYFLSRKTTYTKKYSAIMFKDEPNGETEHRFVFKTLKGVIGVDSDIHHLDEDHLNNHPENLIEMNREDHRRHHAKIWSNKEYKKRISSETLKKRWNLGLVELPKGELHPQYKGWSKSKLLKILFRSGCRIKYAGYDYETIMKYVKLHNVDLDYISDRFTHTGKFITSKDIKSALLLNNNNKAIKELGIGMSKWKRLKSVFYQETNHKFVCIEKINKFVNVYDLEIEETHNYIAGEICSHNCNKPSLQTFPRPIKGLPNTRTFIIPSEKDWILFEADFTALEQYIVAILAKDDVLIQKILDGTDIHSFNAVTLGKALGWIEKHITYEIFVDNVGKGKIKEEDIPKDVYQLYSDLRTKSKTVGFGLNYGKGAESFAEEFGITVAEAETMIDAYFYLYKKIALWRKRTIEKAQNKGEIELLSGRKRRFTLATDWINSPFAKKSWSARIIKEEIARQAMNYPVQGNAHEAFEQGVLRLVGERFKKEGLQARLLLSIHDGIVGECPPHEKEIVAKCIKEEMVALYNEGTPHELWLKIDVGYYKDRWYGEKIK